jgi:hypothetical protein
MAAAVVRGFPDGPARGLASGPGGRPVTRCRALGGAPFATTRTVEHLGHRGARGTGPSPGSCALSRLRGDATGSWARAMRAQETHQLAGNR